VFGVGCSCEGDKPEKRRGERKGEILQSSLGWLEEAITISEAGGLAAKLLLLPFLCVRVCVCVYVRVWGCVNGEVVPQGGISFQFPFGRCGSRGDSWAFCLIRDLIRGGETIPLLLLFLLQFWKHYFPTIATLPPFPSPSPSSSPSPALNEWKSLQGFLLLLVPNWRSEGTSLYPHPSPSRSIHPREDFRRCNVFSASCRCYHLIGCYTRGEGFAKMDLFDFEGFLL